MINQTSIRIFNEDGISEFERIIVEIRNGEMDSVPQSLLFDERFSELLEPIINIDRNGELKNKNELVPSLADTMKLKANKHYYFNKGLWSWLTAFYFDNICPKDGNGNRKINEIAFYVLKDPKDYTKYYRHLLAYPSRLYSELDDSSKIFLIGTFQKRGELTEQIGAYQEIALNRGIVEAANILYWDPIKKVLKRGAAGKGGGSVRRLVRIIRQYQMTYDLNSMNGKEIVKLLPKEFDRWADDKI